MLVVYFKVIFYIFTGPIYLWSTFKPTQLCSNVCVRFMSKIVTRMYNNTVSTYTITGVTLRGW